jgi:predicted DNA-binding transcriptional regulator YafY
MATSSRLLDLLGLLQTRRDWSGEVLAERLDVHVRTVRRDIERLRGLGYRITTFKGPDGGYRLDAGHDLPPLLFDDDQAVALAVALQLVAATGAGLGDRVADAALRALTTVRQVLPARLRHRVDAVPVTAVAPPGTTPYVDPEVLLELGAVVRNREVVRLEHAGARRRVEPHHLVTWRGRWYLLAWDLDRSDWRTFRADRVVPRPPHGPRFAPREVPGGDVAAYVVGRFRGAEAGSTGWPCTGEVVVDLPLAEVAPYVGDGRAEPVDEHRTRLVSGSWSWVALAASLLRFDADVEVVGPPELRAAFGLLGSRAARAGT